MHCITNLHCRKRSWGQGNIFRSMCQEFCSQGGGLPRQVLPPWARCTPPGPGTPPLGRCTPPGRYPLGKYTSPRQVPPWAGTPPRTRYTPGQVHPPRQVHPLGPGTPPGTRYPPGQVHPPEQCMLGDTGNKRAVRILLECILVNCLL